MALQKREKKLLKALGIVVVVSGIILFFVYRPQNQEPVSSTSQQQTPDQTDGERKPSRPRTTTPSSGGGGSGVSNQPTQAQAIISVDEFQRHNNDDDCWVLIKGTVYDITDYLSTLSNKEAASPYCGTYAFEEGFLDASDVRVDEIIEQSSKIGTMG